jgi:hypothetical protein
MYWLLKLLKSNRLLKIALKNEQAPNDGSFITASRLGAHSWDSAYQMRIW